jgi:hypothetical protein
MSDVPEAPGWWQASDGKWYAPEQFGAAAPPSVPPPPAPGPPMAPAFSGPGGGFLSPVLCSVGDIAVSATEVSTPAGRAPLQGSTWIVANSSITTQEIPTWAIVMCVLTALMCLLGLLFLLAKEDRTTGHLQVSVQRPGFFHATAIPVSSPAQIAEIENRVNYIRGLVAQLG